MSQPSASETTWEADFPLAERPVGEVPQGPLPGAGLVDGERLLLSGTPRLRGLRTGPGRCGWTPRACGPSTSSSPPFQNRGNHRSRLGVPVQLGADVAFRVQRSAAQRAGRPAGHHRLDAPAGHGPGLAGGDVEAGQVARPRRGPRPGVVPPAGRRRPPRRRPRRHRPPPGARGARGGPSPARVEADPDGHRPEERDRVPLQEAGALVGGRVLSGELLRHLVEEVSHPLGQHRHLFLLHQYGEDLTAPLGLDEERAVSRARPPRRRRWRRPDRSSISGIGGRPRLVPLRSSTEIGHRCRCRSA